VYLQQPLIAEIVVDVLHHHAAVLKRFVCAPLAQITRTLKSGDPEVRRRNA